MTLPVQLSTVNLFAVAPAERFTVSMPSSESLPIPVSVVAASVKSTFTDSITVSVPAPPRKVSFPNSAVNVSLPARPESTLSFVFPRSVSASAVPITFSIPVDEESVSVRPDTIDCAAVDERSTLTPPLASAVKSSVSVSLFADSTIVTFAARVPVKKKESFPAFPVRMTLPVQLSIVNLFALAPAERLTVSMPSSESLPIPVSVVAVSVKLTSADSTIVSVPLPPENASLPARPVNVSLPARPESRLLLSSPTRRSSNADPITLRNPAIRRKPGASPRERSTVTPVGKAE